MSMPRDTAADAAREAARRPNGEFGTRQRAEADPFDVLPDPAADPDQVIAEAKQSLMDANGGNEWAAQNVIDTVHRVVARAAEAGEDEETILARTPERVQTELEAQADFYRRLSAGLKALDEAALAIQRWIAREVWRRARAQGD